MVTDKKEAKIIEQWVAAFGDEIYKWALYKVNDKEVAEDLVQDTFFSAYKALKNFKENSSPKTWLFSILNFKIIDYYRIKMKEIVVSQSSLMPNTSEVDDDYFDKKGAWKEEEKPGIWQGTTPHLLDNADFKNILDSCIEDLPENWRIAVHLKYIEEKDGNDICQELGISPSNYWQILHRAKLKLRNCLDKKWFNE